jgi:hypothetical protein
LKTRRTLSQPEQHLPANNHQEPDRTGLCSQYSAKMADDAPPIHHEDSIDAQDPANADKGKKVKNRRPASMQRPIYDIMDDEDEGG